ncbi:MAG TPA: hypothetical protein VMF08_08915 [Candidatus Sulfotelmatobacter sp.]|nr:hypothetical protein [Candidatus Sulfotelmatobacter sp.]
MGIESLTTKEKKEARRLPVVSLGAEHLAMGYLMRRNILAYKAPPYNAGYDLICVHPSNAKKLIRVQVKSRYQTDCDRAFPVKEKTIDAFEYLIVVFMNIGYFYRRKPVLEGFTELELYTLPAEWIRKHHKIMESGWQKVHTKGEALDEFKNEKGIEAIAKALEIDYPR